MQTKSWKLLKKLTDDVIEADGAVAGGRVGLSQELPGHLHQLVHHGHAEVLGGTRT